MTRKIAFTLVLLLASSVAHAFVGVRLIGVSTISPSGVFYATDSQAPPGYDGADIDAALDQCESVQPAGGCVLELLTATYTDVQFDWPPHLREIRGQGEGASVLVGPADPASQFPRVGATIELDLVTNNAAGYSGSEINGGVILIRNDEALYPPHLHDFSIDGNKQSFPDDSFDVPWAHNGIRVGDKSTTYLNGGIIENLTIENVAQESIKLETGNNWVIRNNTIRYSGCYDTSGVDQNGDAHSPPLAEWTLGGLNEDVMGCGAWSDQADLRDEFNQLGRKWIGQGIEIEHLVDNVAISGNLIEHSTKMGVNVVSGSLIPESDYAANGTAIDNTIRYVATSGIALVSSEGWDVTSNTVTNVGSPGSFGLVGKGISVVSNGRGTSITDNVVSNTMGPSINLQASCGLNGAGGSTGPPFACGAMSVTGNVVSNACTNLANGVTLDVGSIILSANGWTSGDFASGPISVSGNTSTGSECIADVRLRGYDGITFGDSNSFAGGASYGLYALDASDITISDASDFNGSAPTDIELTSTTSDCVVTSPVGTITNNCVDTGSVAFVARDDPSSSLPAEFAALPVYPDNSGNIPDTTAWPVIDTTDSADMTPLGCGVVDPAVNANQNDVDAIRCAVGAIAVPSVIELPAGDIDCRGAFAGSITRTGCFHFATAVEFLLRGQGSWGATETRLNQETLGEEMFSVGGPGYRNSPSSQPQEGAAIAWTAGYSKGTDVLTVADASGFAAGDTVLVRSRTPDRQSTVDHLEALLEVTCSEGVGPDCSGVGAGQIKIEEPLRNDFRALESTVTEYALVTAHFQGFSINYAATPTVAGDNIPKVILDGLWKPTFVNVDFGDAWNVLVQVGRYVPVSKPLFRGTDFGFLIRDQPWQKRSLQPTGVTHLHMEDTLFQGRVHEYLTGNLYGATFASSYAVQDPVSRVLYGGITVGGDDKTDYPAAQSSYSERGWFAHGGTGATGHITDVLLEGRDFDTGVQFDRLQGPWGDNYAIYRVRGRVAAQADSYNGACPNPQAGGGPSGCIVDNRDGTVMLEAPMPSAAAAQGWGATTVNDTLLIGASSLRYLGKGWVTEASSGRGLGESTRNFGVSYVNIRVDCGLLTGLVPSNGGCTHTQGKSGNDPTSGLETLAFWSNNSVGTGGTEPDYSAAVLPQSLVYSSTPSWWCAESGAYPAIGPGDDFDVSGSLEPGYSMTPAEIRWRRKNGESLTCTTP